MFDADELVFWLLASGFAVLLLVAAVYKIHCLLRADAFRSLFKRDKPAGRGGK